MEDLLYCEDDGTHVEALEEAWLRFVKTTPRSTSGPTSTAVDS